MNFEATKDLLYRIADDDLVIGHRNSEWTGLGPILEEDIAFSSMAQDEVGHAQAYYMLMHEWMNEPAPDTVAFNRSPEDFRSCRFVEAPIGDYAFSLVRHLLYDVAESLRLEHLSKGSFRPLAELSKKLLREERYHLLHATTWIRQLGNSTEEANRRLQEAFNTAYPMAFGMFEPTEFDDAIAEAGLQPKEAELEAQWIKSITELATTSNLQLPEVKNKKAWYGGRTGTHTEHLGAMLKEMTEVFVIDPEAAW
ncbi:MAG: 1,2-phenylacetyl-CoA epoxidase subunit PaaC [Bacteroidota bacterium]